MIMTIHFNVPGKKRKELAHTIADCIGVKAQYMGAPNFTYEMDYFTLDKEGTLEYDSAVDRESILALLSDLTAQGFEYDNTTDDRDCESPEEQSETTAPDNDAGLTISVPLDKVKVGNLTNILEAKADLIKKALGVKNIRIMVDGDKVSFPWFEELPDADTTAAYSTSICKLCEMSVNQTRISAKAKDVENEKYAFRCFLLRLGFIGAEYKEARKILLRNLSGSSAFKSGAKASAEPTEEVSDPFPVEEMVADAILIQAVNQSFDEEVAE